MFGIVLDIVEEEHCQHLLVAKIATESGTTAADSFALWRTPPHGPHWFE